MRSIRTFCEAILVFFLFMGCTLVFYYGILWVSGEYNEYHRYDEPTGKAVKVVQQNMDDLLIENPMWRLRLFLKNGE